MKPFKGAEWDGDRWTGTPPVKVMRAALRRVSKRGRMKNLIYAERRVWFLSQAENQMCPVMLEIFGESRRTSQIHHMRGRGKYLLDESTWLAVSAEGHTWIHQHPMESEKRGWIIRDSPSEKISQEKEK